MKLKICGKQCGTAPVEGNDTLFLGNIDKTWKNEDVSFFTLGLILYIAMAKMVYLKRIYNYIFVFFIQVIKLLQEIGIDKIDKVTVMVDPSNIDRNRGFAFVELETNKDAQSAFKKLQKKEVFGKHQNIKVAWAEPLNEPDENEMMKVCLALFFLLNNWIFRFYGCGLIFVCSWLLIQF